MMRISQLEAVVFTCFLSGSQYIAPEVAPFPQQSQSNYGLTSRVENLKHGIKDNKYVANAKLVVSNQGTQSLTKLSWMYSLCFGNLEKNERGWCVGGGKGGDIDLLKPGQEASKDVTVKYMGGNPDDIDGQKKSLRGMVPHFTIIVTSTDPYKELYKHDHDLTPIGDYPK